MTALDDARQYIGQAFGSTYDSWMALADTPASKTLVSAARYLNALPWMGTATGVIGVDPTSLAWPRSGVFVDGIEVDSLTIPPDVIKASYELAVLINADPSIVSTADQGSNIQSVGGGGAPTVSYFAPTSAAKGTASRYPYMILQLVGKYLQTPGASAEGGLAAGGTSCSNYRQAAQFNLTFPE
jgi:hypothetical protein